ncbi:MAG: hemerythrin domain-containing protein [Pirellulaceae bacterium]
MSAQEPELVRLFLEDHQAMTRALVEVIARIEDHDMAGAQRLADELDRSAGAHIEFEEQVLYPEIGRCRGDRLEEKLRSEHRIVCHALNSLVRGRPLQLVDAVFQQEILQSLKTGLKHAEGCGTLISHLAAWPAAQQERAQQRLLDLRARGKRWTELEYC